MKRGFTGDIEEATIANNDFRRVLYTGEHLQLVLMSLAPGEEIGEEILGWILVPVTFLATKTIVIKLAGTVYGALRTRTGATA